MEQAPVEKTTGKKPYDIAIKELSNEPPLINSLGFFCLFFSLYWVIVNLLLFTALEYFRIFKIPLNPYIGLALEVCQCILFICWEIHTKNVFW